VKYALIEASRLRGGFEFVEIAQPDTNEAKTLPWTQVYSLPQHQSNVCQFLARNGRRCGCMARVKIVKLLVFSLSTTVRAIRDSLRETAAGLSATYNLSRYPPATIDPAVISEYAVG
jgi:hypothetical protein